MNHLRLGMNELPFAPSEAVVQAAQAASAASNRYPDPDGQTLRAALAEHWQVDPNWVVVAGGSAGVILQTMIASGQGEIVFAWPSFDAFPEAARGLRMPVHLAAIQDTAPDLNDMLRCITPKTTMVIVCTPNAPTGGIVLHETLRTFMEKAPSRVTVLIDEAYGEFIREPHAARGIEIVREYPNAIVTRTFSKAYGMAGFRVGYGIAQPALAKKVMRAGMPFSVPLPAQAAAIAALEHPEESLARINVIIAERDRLYTQLQELGAPAVNGHGNFIWLPVGKAATAIYEYLRAHHILVKPFPSLGLRISVGTPEETDAVADAWRALPANLLRDF